MIPAKFALLIALLNLLPMVVVGLFAAGLAGALTGRILRERYRARLLLRDLFFALIGMMATLLAIMVAFYQTDSLVTYGVLVACGAVLGTVASRLTPLIRRRARNLTQIDH